MVVEAGLACLVAGRIEEARLINRRAVKRTPTDAGHWSNLAITELLCGAFTEARTAVARSLELDAANSRTTMLKAAIERWAERGVHPRSFAELNAN